MADLILMNIFCIPSGRYSRGVHGSSTILDLLPILEADRPWTTTTHHSTVSVNINTEHTAKWTLRGVSEYSH